MSNETPVEVFSLVEFLAEEMIAREWTATDVGLRMGGQTPEQVGIDTLTVDLLLAVQVDILVVTSPTTYRALEKAFGVSEGFFERLDAGWHKYPDRRAPYTAPEYLLSR